VDTEDAVAVVAVVAAADQMIAAAATPAFQAPGEQQEPQTYEDQSTVQVVPAAVVASAVAVAHCLALEVPDLVGIVLVAASMDPTRQAPLVSVAAV